MCAGSCVIRHSRTTVHGSVNVVMKWRSAVTLETELPAPLQSDFEEQRAHTWQWEAGSWLQLLRLSEPASAAEF